MDRRLDRAATGTNELRARQAGLQTRAATAARTGSAIPDGAQRPVAEVILVLLVDFCLLLYFFSGITDVNWADPLGANLVFAVLLAVMVTVLMFIRKRAEVL